MRMKLMDMKRIAPTLGCLLAVFLGCVPASADRFALVIGIDDYQIFGKLTTCRNDAKLVREVLLQNAGFRENRVILLTDDAREANLRPTRGFIRSRIQQFASLTASGDTLLVYFSGHGMTADGQGYLVPLDGSRSGDDCVALSWVKTQLRSSKASAKMLVLDACHSGSAAKGVSGIAPSLTENTDLLMLLSCGENQFSFPDDQGENSVFSRYLAEGLTGKADADSDGQLTSVELSGFVRGKLIDWCLASGKTQTPVMYPSDHQPLLLATITERALLRLTADLVAVSGAEYPPLEGLAPGSREARERQKQAVEDLGLPLEVGTRKTDIVFRLIPAGSFVMGSAGSERDACVQAGGELKCSKDETEHHVTLSLPFYCGKFEVTQGQWQAVMGSNPSRFTSAGSDAPVEQVSWDDCQIFCRKLCTLEGVSVGTYGLLTEAQWEYACRAGTSAPFCYGNDLGSSMANFDGDFPFGTGRKGVERGTTIAVGQFRPNAWGLYDMHGNVYEWCQDWYGEEYLSGNGTDPEGPGQGSPRVGRGGSWNINAGRCRSANRCWSSPDYRFSCLGFRLLRVVRNSSSEG